MEKTYLGDGAYANFDGHHVVLTAENGVQATDTICLETEVLKKLINFIRRLPEGHPVRDELENLYDRDNKLYHLECGGVDNWEWYGESLKDYFEEEEDEEED